MTPNLNGGEVMNTKHIKINWVNLFVAARRSGVSEFVLNQFKLMTPYTVEVKKDDTDSSGSQDAWE